MSNDGLLRMLDLDGKEVPEESEALPITSAGEGTEVNPASPTALRLDDWGLRRGEDMLRESERLRQCLAALGDEDRQAHAVADFHGAAFEVDPQLNEDCTDPLRRDFIKQLLETPECQELRTSTVLNDLASEIAATAFAGQYAELRKERDHDEKKEPGKDSRPGDDFGGEITVLKHVSKALAEATKEVEEAKEAAGAMGMGPGSPGSNDPKAIAALFKRVRSDPALRRICELAGRYRRVAQSKQRRKATHGLDDVVGVVMDADLGRLLPQELAKLAIPEFEDDILRRLVERQTMCREYRATEPVAKGPIVVVVDESGSMEGQKVHTAKALSLALAWVARQQRRWCALVAFSGSTEGRLLPLPPGRWDEIALADWLTAFLGGGTSCDVPLVELPNRYWKELGCPPGQALLLYSSKWQNGEDG